MALSSLQLIEQCEQRGLLSKEAADDARRLRETFVKEAARRGVRDILENMFQRGSAQAAPAPAKGWFDKLVSPSIHPERGGSRQWSDVTSNLAKMLGLAGLTAGAAGGLNMAAHSIGQGRQRAMIERSYESLYDEEPGLHTIDPDKVRRTFGLVARYAPSLAADPTVAASTVHTFVQRGGGDIMKDVRALSELEAQIRKAREMTPVVKPEKAIGWAAKGIGMGGGGGGDDD